MLDDILINDNDYKIGDLIGTGDSGYVYEAIDNKTKQKVAIKFIANEDDDLSAKIPRSVSVFHQLKLPGTIKILGYSGPTNNDQRFAIVSEFAKNGSIAELKTKYIESNGAIHDKMNPTVRSKIFFGVAATMKQLHKHNAIYRVLRLENVVLDDNLEPKLLHCIFQKFITDPKKMMGGIGLIFAQAPEVFNGEHETYSFPVDVYAYAFFLYCMFTNQIKISGQSIERMPSIKLMFKINSGIRLDRPVNIPDHYWELIEKCWQGDYAKRPTFDEIVEILKDDKYALEEFGMKTDLKILHEYQKRIDPIPGSLSSNSILVDQLQKENKELTEKIKKYESILQFSSPSLISKDNYIIDESDEESHKVVLKIGEGATSVTYKVIDTKTSIFMCKKILKESSSSFNDLKNAIKEFEVLYSLNHPCICRAIGMNTSEKLRDSNIDEDQDITTVAIFLEYLTYSLKDQLKKQIDNTLKVRIVIDIVHAMRYIHKKGLIHRDLKIENIMLNSVFEAKVVDFGLVRIHESLSDDYSFVNESMTKGVGTLAYMSPEMIGEKDYDYKTDVYSFGVVLYYIFVGNLPKYSITDKTNNKPFPLPSQSSSISSLCIDIIKKCTKHNPLDRPSFDDILNDLRKNNYSLADYVDQSIISRRDNEIELFETK